MERRAFVRQCVMAGAPGLLLPGIARAWKRPSFLTDPFSLGVASGDPHDRGVVLWTRLAPDPLRGGGMPPETVEVNWWVSADDRFQRIVRQGTAVATPELGHSVHVEVDGLEPDRWYWYRFQAGGDVSPTGRTRTTPPDTALAERLRLGVVSCQHYEQGYYTAYRHLAREDLDLVVHLGDYIYEYEGDASRVRMHAGKEVQSLEDYRNRYALYQCDPDLQAAHAAFPWALTWDDHEVDNDYAGTASQDQDPVDAFLTRRAAAYQAYYEHLPLRRTSMPRGPFAQLYRGLRYGSLVDFSILDTRQYRSDQPCGGRMAPFCPAALDPKQTMMGPEQERWLLDRVGRSSARWNVLAQQVLMVQADSAAGPEERYSMDKWNGYVAERTRLLTQLHQRRVANPVVLTGDNHNHWVNDLKLDFRDLASPTVATEFAGTSISSGGDGEDSPAWTQVVRAENPHVKFVNSQRGYVRCEVTPAAWRSDYRVVEYVTQPGAGVSTRATFAVENGRPGAQAV
ncbi:MAG TPA: alkaline phosphatase D family protein [Gemmatimonadales bacterium]|nr:alkaline phosphatase D family protein [Gemmatimonadales bacterium]